MRRKIISFGLVILGLGVLADKAGAADKLPVFVSILPQAYFVERIGGERVAVQVMVQPGASPATYEPKPRQMAALAGTKLYFAIGVPFEKTWLPRIMGAHAALKIVHTDQGIEKMTMQAHHHEEEEAEGEKHEDHDHITPDPHVWVSPPDVLIQAQNITTALQQADPEHRDFYETNRRAFASDIQALDTEIRSILADKRDQRFMVFHPSWGYFARAYGLQQIAIEIEGKDPKPAQLQELIKVAREQQIRVVFVQPQFSTKSAGLIAEAIGGKIAFADPLARDWLVNLKSVAAVFRQALR